MRYRLSKKGLVVGIIILYFGIGIVSDFSIATSIVNESKSFNLSYEGDLKVLQPTLLSCFNGHYKLLVKITNIGEKTSQAPFYDSFIWDLGQESEQVLHPEYLHEDDILEYDTVVYWIEFDAPKKGDHTITILTDCHLEDDNLNDLVFEEDETNNCFTTSYHFWWSRSKVLYSSLFMKLLEHVPLLEKILS